MKSKPLQVYLSLEERQQLEKAKLALGEKTLSATIKRLTNVFLVLSE